MDLVEGMCRGSRVTEAGQAHCAAWSPRRFHKGPPPPSGSVVSALRPLLPCPPAPAPPPGSPHPGPASHSKPTSSPSLAQVPTLITIWHPHPPQHLPPEANPSQSTQAQPQKTRKRVPPCPAPCCRLALRPLAGGRGCRGAGVQAQSHWGEWGGEVLRVSVSGFMRLSHVGDKS